MTNPRRAAAGLFAAAALAGGLLLFVPGSTGGPDPQPRRNGRVILLLGFEPFGGGTTNSSWEAVRRLDGATVAGHRLAARQLPVVWGAPMREISARLEELDPAAVFAFGQGLPGVIKFERVGRNLRGATPDGRGNPPAEAETLPGGPERYVVRMRADRLVAELGARFSLTISEDAGSYLCEEAVYSLEHLCRRRGGVPCAFLHLPPLGSPLWVEGATRTCDPELLGDFVREVIRHWAAGGPEAPGG